MRPPSESHTGHDSIDPEMEGKTTRDTKMDTVLPGSHASRRAKSANANCAAEAANRPRRLQGVACVGACPFHCRQK
jgi:hypothetical protein